jgi:hypothetical protein
MERLRVDVIGFEELKGEEGSKSVGFAMFVSIGTEL